MPTVGCKNEANIPSSCDFLLASLLGILMTHRKALEAHTPTPFSMKKLSCIKHLEVLS